MSEIVTEAPATESNSSLFGIFFASRQRIVAMLSVAVAWALGVVYFLDTSSPPWWAVMLLFTLWWITAAVTATKKTDKA